MQTIMQNGLEHEVIQVLRERKTLRNYQESFSKSFRPYAVAKLVELRKFCAKGGEFGRTNI